MKEERKSSRNTSVRRARRAARIEAARERPRAGRNSDLPEEEEVVTTRADADAHSMVAQEEEIKNPEAPVRIRVPLAEDEKDMNCQLD